MSTDQPDQFNPLPEQLQNQPTQDQALVNVAANQPAATTQPATPAPPVPDVNGLPVASKTSPQVNPVVQTPQKSFFDKAVEAFGGGPIRKQVPDPDNPGKFKTVEVPQTKKSISAHIMAGVLSGILNSGPSQYGPEGNPDLLGNLSAGAKAGQEKLQEIQQKPQQIDDQARARAYNTLKSNLELHAAMMNNVKLDEDYRKRAVDENAAFADALNQYETDHPATDQSQRLVLERGLTADQVIGKGEGNLLKTNAIIDGWQPTGGKNPDGTPEYHPTYTIVSPYAKIALTKELKNSIGDTIPGVQNVSENALIDARLLVASQNRKIELVNAEGELQNAINKSWQVNGKQSSEAPKANPKSLLIGVPTAAQKLNLQLLGKYSGEGLDKMLTDMQKDGADPNFLANLRRMTGYDEVNWTKYRAEEKRIEGQQPISAQQYQGVQSVINKANLTATQKASLFPQIHADMSQVEFQHVMDKLGEFDHQNRELAQNQPAAPAAVPSNFTLSPEAPSKPEGDLRQELTQKGVKIPPDFATLYAIGHNDASIDQYTSNPRKGSGRMARNDATAFIRTYVNPQWQEGDYKAANTFRNDMASNKQGSGGAVIVNAGTAAQHLATLEQAATALSSGNVQFLNGIANKIGVAVGKDPVTTFKAIAEQANGEVGKVVAGGTPHEAELAQLRENLSADQSPKQVKGVIKAYIDLMGGRIGSLDEKAMQYTGHHVKGLSPNVTALFQRYGAETPWATGQQVQQQQQPQGRPVVRSGQVIGYTIDGKTMTPAVR